MAWAVIPRSSKLKSQEVTTLRTLAQEEWEQQEEALKLQGNEEIRERMREFPKRRRNKCRALTIQPVRLREAVAREMARARE